MKKLFFALTCIFLYSCSGYGQVKKMKLLIVTDKFPWASRPFINNQIAGLIDKGHDVYVLATSTLHDASITKCLKGYNLSKRVFYQSLPQSQHDFDVILVQFPQNVGNEQIWKNYKKETLKGKLVLFFRGEDLSAMIKRNKHRYDELFKMAHLFLPVCDYFKQRLIKLGCNPKKIKVIHSAIDCNQFKFRQPMIDPDKGIELISVSRLVGKKGIKFAVLAAVRLHARYPTLRYSIIGNGREQPMLVELIKLLDAQEYIHLVGSLPHYKVAEKLREADIFVLPSVTAFGGDQEGIPNALMEAMATGLPVVSTYHSGIPELIAHGERGLLSGERDVEVLVANISYFIEHPSECVKMSLAAHDYVVAEHNHDIEIERLEQLLLNLT